MSATKWITELGILDGKFASALYINRGIHPEIKNYFFTKSNAIIRIEFNP